VLLLVTFLTFLTNGTLATQHVVLKSALKYLKLLEHTFDYFSHQFISNMIGSHVLTF
jgi:hypothetical protein